MNQLIESNKLTMSSLEIAELTGKRHADVMRDIRNMLEELHSAQKCAQYKDSTGRTLPMILLNREETDCLITGYSAKLRMLVIKRWHELEAKDKAIPNFNDPVESARAWADAKEAELKALDQLEAQKPMVNYYDLVSKNESHMNATQVAQKMNLTATKMNKYLDDLGVYNKSIKRGRTFNHWFIESGYGMMKQTDAGYSQAVFTTKGEQYIIEKFTSEGII